MDLVGLVEELERQRKNSLDLIVDSTALKAVPDSVDGVRLRIPEYGDFPLTDWAHGQLADKLGIPRKYYERMRKEGKAELLAENINAWMFNRERGLIRILDGRVRAILSDRYRMIDNYDLVFLVLDEFRRREAIEIYRMDLTEIMLYIKAIDRMLTASVGDIIYGGLIIRNSEVGASALRIEPFILRRVCSNGLILQRSLKRIHLGRQSLDVGEIDWSDETRELEDRALWSKIRDIIRTTFNEKIFGMWVERLRESSEAKIEKPIKAVDSVARFAGLSDEEKKKLLMYFSEHTKFGLANAISNLAKEMKSIDEQVRLEEFGGEILMKSVEELIGK